MITALSSEIRAAIEELESYFPERVIVLAEDVAGAIVRITRVELSVRWTPRQGDLWLQVPYHYPDAAIYPYYITGAIPTGGLITGLQPTTWREMPVTQVSLRHNGWNPAVDTALGSVLQAQAWLRSR